MAFDRPVGSDKFIFHRSQFGRRTVAAHQTKLHVVQIPQTSGLLVQQRTTRRHLYPSFSMAEENKIVRPYAQANKTGRKTRTESLLSRRRQSRMSARRRKPQIFFNHQQHNEAEEKQREVTFQPRFMAPLERS
jgi:hypothetical protein